MTLYDKNQNQIKITSNSLAGGGEGEIFMYPNSKTKVIKVYHQPRSKDFEKTLKQLATLSDFFIKPTEMFYTNKGELAGFAMKFVNFNKYFLLNNLFNKGFCSKNNITISLKEEVLNKIKTAVLECHQKSLIIGDLNQYNIFFNLKGEVLFIDVDSYSVKGSVKTDVLIEDIRDFTQANISETSDAYAYSVLSFWILTFCHPFKWTVPGNTETLEKRVLLGKSFLSNIPNIKIPALYQEPTPTLKPQFVEIFNNKRRFFIDIQANTAPKPLTIQVSVAQNLTSKDVTIQYIDEGTELKVASNRVALKRGTDWKLFNTENKGALIPGILVTAEDIFLGKNRHCVLKEGQIFGDSAIKQGQPLQYNAEDCSYFFQNEQLFILNSSEDCCYIYQIDNQMAGVDCLRHVIFTQSFIIRSAIMQNFGIKKVVIRLQNKTMSLINIPFTTKDVILHDNYFCAEYIENGKTLTSIFKVNNLNAQHILQTDNLVDFTVSGDMIMVPADGEIRIYKDGVLIMNLIVPICTKNANLHFSFAGILLFDNNKLYLLNKK